MSYSVQQLVTEEGTWVPTWTGFSADPTSVNARYYVLQNKFCVAELSATAGTSNATTLTVTLPKTHANTFNANVPVTTTNSGTRESGLGIFTANSNIFTIARVSAAAYTASGNKLVTFTIIYPIN